MLRAFLISIVLIAAMAAAQDRPAAVTPGDDFFAYANRDWLATVRIPPDKGRWGARDEIASATAAQVAQVIGDARSTTCGA